MGSMAEASLLGGGTEGPDVAVYSTAEVLPWAPLLELTEPTSALLSIFQ